MDENQGLIFADLFDQQGQAREVGWKEIKAWRPEAGFLWVHLDRTAPTAQAWLQAESGLDPIMTEALLAEETRPRSLTVGGSLLVILRGVNLNPGADPEDMVSIRLWIDAHRVISLRAPRLLAVQDVRDSISAGHGPHTPGEFLAEIAARLVARMSPVLGALDDELDALEEELLTAQSREIRIKLSALRRQAITLRRYIAPQRDVMSRLLIEPLAWVTPNDRARLREVTDHITRYVEDLDAIRERAAVTQEELASRLSDQMNRTMYILSLVAAVFLPLGFLTGLLGINVAGIPGSESQLGFIVVCVILLVIAGIETLFFYTKRWF